MQHKIAMIGLAALMALTGCDNSDRSRQNKRLESTEVAPTVEPTENLTPEPTEEPTPVPTPLKDEKRIIIAINSNLIVELMYYKYSEESKAYFTVECPDCQEGGEEKEPDWIMAYEANGSVSFNPKYLANVRILASIKR